MYWKLHFLSVSQQHVDLQFWKFNYFSFIIKLCLKVDIKTVYMLELELYKIGSVMFVCPDLFIVQKSKFYCNEFPSWLISD